MTQFIKHLHWKLGEFLFSINQIMVIYILLTAISYWCIIYN